VAAERGLSSVHVEGVRESGKAAVRAAEVAPRSA
jgi:hypothetical protein